MSSSASRANSPGSVSRAPAPRASSASPGSPPPSAAAPRHPAARWKLRPGGLIAEWRTVLGDVRARLRGRGARAVPVALGASAGILLLQLLQHVHATSGWVERLGGVYASLP